MRRPSVRFIHNYFFPDVSSVAQIISDIAFHLADRGCRVSVITSRNSYVGGPPWHLPSHDVVRGVDVRRVWGASLGKRSMLRRMIDHGSFVFGATLTAFFARKTDVVILLTNPPMFALLGVLLKWMRRQRFVYVVMDLYPDFAIRANLLRAGSLTARLMAWITRLTMRSADRVIVLGECMKVAVARHGASPDKVRILRNWADDVAIEPLDHGNNAFRLKHGWEQQFVVMYSGNMGYGHRFEDLLEVARRVSDHRDLLFVFVGDGVRRQSILDFQQREGLSNIVHLPYQDRSLLTESLGAADIHFVTLSNGFEGLVVPSKAYAIMAAGRPILYQGSPDGEIARMVLDRCIGSVVNEGDVDGLERELLRLYHDRILTANLGRLARAVLETEYTMRQALQAYEDMLAEVTAE